MPRTPIVAALALALAATGCGETGWRAEKIDTIEGFRVPEGVAVGQDGTVYVANVVKAEKTDPGRNPYWSADGRGFISRLAEWDGRVFRAQVFRWRNSRPDRLLHGPKGMALYDGAMYVADLDRVVRLSLSDAGAGDVALERKGAMFNDVATDGRAVYASDTDGGDIWRLAPGKAPKRIPAPEGINGLVFGGPRNDKPDLRSLYGVSWGLHEVFELHPTDGAEPRPLGLAKHFKALDGIAVLPDKSLLVSDFKGNAVFVISPDQTEVTKLVEATTPADILYDDERNLLFVPEFKAGRVSVYKLTYHP